MPDLQKFAENVSIIDGPPVRAIAVPLSTRMIVVKLADDSLWVNSPVSVALEVLDRIAASGPVRYLVARTKLHVWRLEEWHTLFPDAELWGPPQIPNKFKCLPFAGILGDAPPHGWTGDLDQLIFKGNFFIDEVFFFHKKSRTVILADFIQNHPIAKGKPLRNALFKLAGVAYPHGGVALDIRLSFANRNLARQSLEKLLSWDFDKLIIAHGICLEKDAMPFVERAFRWLMRWYGGSYQKVETFLTKSAQAVKRARLKGLLVPVTIITVLALLGFLYVEKIKQEAGWEKEVEVDFSKAPLASPNQAEWLKESFVFKNREATSLLDP